MVAKQLSRKIMSTKLLGKPPSQPKLHQNKSKPTALEKLFLRSKQLPKQINSLPPQLYSPRPQHLLTPPPTSCPCLPQPLSHQSHSLSCQLQSSLGTKSKMRDYGRAQDPATSYTTVPYNGTKYTQNGLAGLESVASRCSPLQRKFTQGQFGYLPNPPTIRDSTRYLTTSLENSASSCSRKQLKASCGVLGLSAFLAWQSSTPSYCGGDR